MGKAPSGTAYWVSTLAVLVLLAGALITHAALWWGGNWEAHRWGLTLTLRIVWGCWIVVFLATLLTRTTIFAWYFRRYLRWPPGGAEAGPPPATLPRPTRAPWVKSGAASFSISVVLVSLTGGCAVATAVMWILKDVTGDWVFWLVFKIIWSAWWVLAMAAVLTRIAIFATHRKKAASKPPPAPPPPPPPAAPSVQIEK
jgi:hypothetical protein